MIAGCDKAVVNKTGLPYDIRTFYNYCNACACVIFCKYAISVNVTINHLKFLTIYSFSKTYTV